MEKIYTAKITRIGTSHGFILPVPILKALNLLRGDYVVFAIYHDGQFVARKLTHSEVSDMKPREILMD